MRAAAASIDNVGSFADHGLLDPVFATATGPSADHLFGVEVATVQEVILREPKRPKDLGRTERCQ